MNADDPLIGTLVSGRYRVIKPLGEGGMGQVYLAMHEAIEKKIALKVLRVEYSAKEDIVRRFQQEAISASRIKHPNVLEVFDFGTLENGCAYLAMEFLSGNDIADELSALGSIETARCLKIMFQVCKALAAVHKAGVVHRDMKPDNIFLLKTEDGEETVKIVDFGIAQLRNAEDEAKSQPTRRRLTKTGMIFGTPEYMAPEQAAGKKADLRVDVYACGIILFEMFTGAVPFTGDSFMAVLAAHLNDTAPSMHVYRPDLRLSDAMHAVVARALEKGPDRRFQSMAEFASALLATPEGAAYAQLGEYQPISHIPPPMTSSSAPPAGFPGQPAGYQTAAQFNPHTRGPGGAGAAYTPAEGGSDPGMARSYTAETAVTGGTNPPKGSGGAAVALGIGAIVIALAAAGFVIVPQLSVPVVDSDAPVLAVTQATPRAPVAPPPTVSAPPAATTPTVEVATEPTKVTIEVETDPPGALLQMDGAQVCEKTPCEIRVEPGDAVDFLATLGTMRGATKVNPQGDQKVTIKLRKPPPRKPSQPRLCEAMAGGLKILRPCPE